jgi:hypothetical protein
MKVVLDLLIVLFFSLTNSFLLEFIGFFIELFSTIFRYILIINSYVINLGYFYFFTIFIYIYMYIYGNCFYQIY